MEAEVSTNCATPTLGGLGRVMCGICEGISGGARGLLGSHALGSRCLHSEATCEAALPPARRVAMDSGDHVGARAGAGRRERGGGAGAAGEGAGGAGDAANPPRAALALLPPPPPYGAAEPGALCAALTAGSARGALSRAAQPETGPRKGKGARAAPRRPGRAQAG